MLKDIVDPAPKRADFKAKYRQAFDGMSYCSFWLRPITATHWRSRSDDRRFTVLRNGREMLPDEALDIVAWTDDATNIGALSRMLQTRDLSGFNMLRPLDTAGKTEMAILARSEVDELLRDWMEDPACGLAFTKMQIERAIANNLGAQNTFWRGEFKAAWNVFCARLVRSSGSTRRTLVEGTQRKLFCFRSNKARVDKMPEAALRREVGKWGGMELLKTALSGLPGGRGLDEKDD